jgi:hypothetical protein
LTIFDTSPQEGCETEKNAHALPNYSTSVPAGWDFFRRNPEPRSFLGLALVFVDQQKPVKVLVDNEI